MSSGREDETRVLTGPLLLGRYRLGPVIGRGGMSTVHRGEDTQMDRPVAIKILAPHLSSDPEFRRRLLAEARAAARLPHPHIVQVFDAGAFIGGGDRGQGHSSAAATVAAEEGSVVLVLELVEGESLRRRLDSGTLPLEQAVEIAAQVADALAFAHERGIVHRDVKPHNILLAAVPPDAGGARAWAKLADFGIARSIDATSTVTATGFMLGSAPYIAPELLEGERAGPQADVYALGVTLFQALTGRLPFGGETTAATLAQRLSAEAPRVRSVRDDVPPWLDGLVARAMARDPAARFADAAALARALRDPHGATTQVLVRPPAATATAAGPPTGKRGGAAEGTAAAPVWIPVGALRPRALAVAGAAALLGALALVAIGASSRPRPLVGGGAAPMATVTPAEPPTPTAIPVRPR